MVQTSENRVRLDRLEWAGLGSLALTLVSLVGATLLAVHELAHTNRERLAAVDTDLDNLHKDVELLQTDVRDLARRHVP